MNLFEPLFLLLALVTLGTLLTAAAFAATGRFARAGRILRRWLIGAAAYFAAVIAVTLVSPRTIHVVGDTQCFDDWCIAVESGQRLSGPEATYAVSLRLSNRARGRTMGERGTVAYLTDAQNRRYDPLPDPDAVPFDTPIAPGASVVTVRRFHVPPDAASLGFVYTHEGGFPIGWLIIGEGGWFASPPMVRLD
jgi:hypothetical protein